MILGVLLIMVKGIGVDLIDNIRFEKLIKNIISTVMIKCTYEKISIHQPRKEWL